VNTVSPRVVDFLRSSTGQEIAPDSFYHLYERDAVRHMFRVSSSLDSMVLGEAQILGQVKDCYERARDLGLVDKHLHHLFQFAFRTAKRIRSDTHVGAGAVSVSSVAVRLAEQVLGDLKDRSVLVMGSGQMAELALLHLKAKACHRIRIANRTVERASELAQRVGASAMGLEQIEEVIGKFDVVIGSLSIDKPLIEAQRMKRLLGKKPQFFIDLGVPRNFPELISELEDVYLYTVDDLAKIGDEHREVRELAKHDAEIMIDYSVLQFDRWLDKVEREPFILDLRAQIRELCADELVSAAELKPERRSEISHRLSERIAHRLTKVIQEIPAAQAPHPEVVALFLEALARKDE
jgi:glutamyl-tRNA reductase